MCFALSSLSHFGWLFRSIMTGVCKVTAPILLGEYIYIYILLPTCSKDYFSLSVENAHQKENTSEINGTKIT